MKIRKLATLLIFCVALCVMVGLLTDQADAIDASKKGMDSLGSKEIDKDRLANNWQMGLGFGSVVVAFAVVKWL